MVTIHTIETIVSDPDIRGGKPIIVGTGLRVSDIAAYHVYGGLTAEELAVQFKLTLAQAHAALAYYYEHKAETDAEIRTADAEAETLIQQLRKQGRVKTIG